MLRIENSWEGRTRILHLSGRIRAEDLFVLQMECEKLDTVPVLDLEEIQLVDEAAVRFLADCESHGAVLRHCPGYISEWIRRERESKSI